MRDSMGDQFTDLHFGKFDSAMANYLYSEMLLNGDFGDDEYSDGEGTWGHRYGRRVLEGDDRGFVYYAKLASVDEASAAFRQIAEVYEVDEEAIR